MPVHSAVLAEGIPFCTEERPQFCFYPQGGAWIAHPSSGVPAAALECVRLESSRGLAGSLVRERESMSLWTRKFRLRIDAFTVRDVCHSLQHKYQRTIQRMK